MNMNHKALLACLMLVSSAVSAQNFRNTLSYRIGQPAPSTLFTDNDMVNDYHHYHLIKPVSGYEWVRAENDQYLLVSITTHIIRDIAHRPNIPPESK